MAAVMLPRMRGGLDLGGTKIQAVVTDGESTVLGKARRETPRRGNPEEVAFELAETLRAALDDAGVELLGLGGIGVGSPGSIDAESGTVSQVVNIDGWDGPFALGPWLEAELERPVRIGNDVNVAIEAERRFGAGRDSSRSSVSSGERASAAASWSTAAISWDAGLPVRSATCARSRAAAAATAGSTAASRRTPAGARSRSAHASSRRNGRPSSSS